MKRRRKNRFEDTTYAIWGFDKIKGERVQLSMDAPYYVVSRSLELYIRIFQPLSFIRIIIEKAEEKYRFGKRI